MMAIDQDCSRAVRKIKKIFLQILLNEVSAIYTYLVWSAGIGYFPLLRGVTMNFQTFEGGQQEVMTLNDLCRWMRIPPATIYRMVRESRIPFLKFGRLLRFEKQKILIWATERSGGTRRAFVEGGLID
jgi:excisionase family DNA binding protein